MSGVTEQQLVFETGFGGIDHDDIRVIEVEGVEEVSTLYRFRLRVEHTEEGGLSPEDTRALMAAPCGVGFGEFGASRASGVLESVDLVHVTQDGMVSYEFVLRPRFWLSTLSRKSRAFNEMSIVEIFTKIFVDDYGWSEGQDFEFRLEEYPVREYVVQYEETDFNFISRWAEHYGIFYFFEQNDSGDKLVLADSNREVGEVPGFAFMDFDHMAGGDGHEVQPGYAYGIKRDYRQRPAKAHVRDFNWRGPSIPTGDADVDTSTGFGLWGEFGGHFKDPNEGAKLAQVRAEEWLARSERYRGSTTTGELRPGSHFTLRGAPLGDLDIKYLVTRVVHEASQTTGSGHGGRYTNHFEGVHYDTPYRPPRVTPKPRIDGVLYAIVDGAGGSVATPIDDQGRYRVQLPFDMFPGDVSQATRWIRMAQSLAGPNYGMHFPLQVGTEVAVGHIGGDPDRPVILGALPNPSRNSYISSARATQSAIRTQSGILFKWEDDAKP